MEALLRQSTRFFVVGLALAVASFPGESAQGRASAAENPATIQAAIDRAALAILPRVVAWRRDFHEHPELGNREQRTAKIVAPSPRFFADEGALITGVRAMANLAVDYL